MWGHQGAGRREGRRGGGVTRGRCWTQRVGGWMRHGYNEFERGATSCVPTFLFPRCNKGSQLYQHLASAWPPSAGAGPVFTPQDLLGQSAETGVLIRPPPGALPLVPSGGGADDSASYTIDELLSWATEGIEQQSDFSTGGASACSSGTRGAETVSGTGTTGSSADPLTTLQWQEVLIASVADTTSSSSTEQQHPSAAGSSGLGDLVRLHGSRGNDPLPLLLHTGAEEDTASKEKTAPGVAPAFYDLPQATAPAGAVLQHEIEVPAGEAASNKPLPSRRAWSNAPSPKPKDDLPVLRSNSSPAFHDAVLGSSPALAELTQSDLENLKNPEVLSASKSYLLANAKLKRRREDSQNSGSSLHDKEKSPVSRGDKSQSSPDSLLKLGCSPDFIQRVEKMAQHVEVNQMDDFLSSLGITAGAAPVGGGLGL